MHKVAQFTAKQREEFFSETARHMGITIDIVEKDFEDLEVEDGIAN